MAEYYAVLKKAVGGFDAGSAEARRAVYDKARNALIGQLKAIDPPLAASEISRQRLELEEAIRRVERETASGGQAPRPQRSAEAEQAPATAPDNPPQPLPPTGPSPQDIFRRAIQEAESRGAAAAAATERPPARGPIEYSDRGPDVRPAGNWAQGRPEYRTDTGPDYGTEAPPSGYEVPRPARQPGPDPYLDRRDRPSRAAPQRKGYLEEDDSDLADRPARRSRLPTILLVLLILGMIGGLGALAWSQRSVISSLIAEFDGGNVDNPPAVETAADAVDPTGKADDRMPGDEATDLLPAGPDAIADTIAGAPEAPAGPLVAQKAVLYEEPLDAATAAAGVTAINAIVTWRFVEDGSGGPAVEANLEVPERSMTVRLSIRRNADPTLPASHLVEAVINTPPDFPGKGIRGIPRLVLKASEDERGQPLVGAAAKVADGFFWIALSATGADVARNLRLLKEGQWIDLPIVYETGQRAILTFEKGTPGERAFERALAAWSTG